MSNSIDPRGDAPATEPSEGARLVVFHCNGGQLVRPRPLDIDGVSEVFLPCTGRVDLATALEALEQGAGGVLLVGCAESECRFPHPDGGCQAESIARRARRVVELLGMGADRISFRTLEAGASLRDVVEEGLAAAEGDAISSASTNEPSDETRGGGNVS